MEIRVSCFSNEIDLTHGIQQQAKLVELAHLARQLEALRSNRGLLGELTILREECSLLKTRDALWESLSNGWADRAVAVSDVMSQCGFSDCVPCRNILVVVPLADHHGPPIMTLREVALGQSIFPWIYYWMRRYRRNRYYHGKSKVELEQQLWRDLPSELRRWVDQPKPEPDGFLNIWRHVLSAKGGGLPAELNKSLESMRQGAREERGNLCCPVCNPDNRSRTGKPRGGLIRRMLARLKRAL
jgi:hypothetical protein